MSIAFSPSGIPGPERLRPALRHRLLDTDATLTLGGISPTEKSSLLSVLLATATFAIMVVDPKAPCGRSSPIRSSAPTLRSVWSSSYWSGARSSAAARSDPIRSFSIWSSRADHTLHGARRDSVLPPQSLRDRQRQRAVGVQSRRPDHDLPRRLYPVLIFVAVVGSSPTSSASSAPTSSGRSISSPRLLIAYLGEHERRSKQKLGVMLDFTTAVRPADLRMGAHSHHAPHPPPFRRAPWRRGPARPESRRYFTWDMVDSKATAARPPHFGARSLSAGRSRARPRRSCVIPRGHGLTALCYDVVSGATQRKMSRVRSDCRSRRR